MCFCETFPFLLTSVFQCVNTGEALDVWSPGLWMGPLLAAVLPLPSILGAVSEKSMKWCFVPDGLKPKPTAWVSPQVKRWRRGERKDRTEWDERGAEVGSGWWLHHFLHHSGCRPHLASKDIGLGVRIWQLSPRHLSVLLKCFPGNPGMAVG